MTENTSQETLALTLKLKILPESQDQVTSFKQIMTTYKDACNIVSQYIFDNIPKAAETKSMSSLLSPINLQKTAIIDGKRIYDILRKQLGLPSQAACDVFRTVISNYKTIQTILKNTNSEAVGLATYLTSSEVTALLSDFNISRFWDEGIEGKTEKAAGAFLTQIEQLGTTLVRASGTFEAVDTQQAEDFNNLLADVKKTWRVKNVDAG